MESTSGEGSSNSREKLTYQVFLSFRGEELRKKFIDHLHHALKKRGIRTFHDDSELPRGCDIQEKIYEAIESSKLSIVTFSPDYAKSRWCLDELARIMECRHSNGHVVFPIFYDVDPDIVWLQSGSYQDAFKEHEIHFKDDLEKVKRWRDCLRAVADLAGFPLQSQADGHEARFIENVIKKVVKILDMQQLSVPRHLVGLTSTVKDLNDWIQNVSKDVSVGVIYGMSGVGKTTTAMIVYNTNCHDFNGHSFIFDVGRVSSLQDGVIRLQTQLIFNISHNEAIKIYNVHEGKQKIKEVIGSKRILVVFDDVQEPEQLSMIFDHRNLFHPGSKIIITTKNQGLLNLGIHTKSFHIPVLNMEDSTKLFCLHAFDQDHPFESYIELSEIFIQYCGGLPIALKILALSLQKRNLYCWKGRLGVLEHYPDQKICGALRLGFDSIEDDYVKEIFLHIAFYMVGMKEEYALMILEGCGLHPEVGLQYLVDRCLLLRRQGRLLMHQLVQEMGHEVVRLNAPEDLGQRSRLYGFKDPNHVLQNKMGTTTIKGLHFDISSHDSYSSSGSMCITTDVFKKMNRMNLLLLNGVEVDGKYEDLPKTIKWLIWQNFSLDSIPLDFHLGELVVLEMRGSSLVQAWIDKKHLHELRVLDLSHSLLLVSAPDLSNTKRLEHISLEGCISLVELHESFGNLQNLTYLNLKGCENLKFLPRSICEGLCLPSLKKLDLSNCSSLFPCSSQIEPTSSKLRSIKSLIFSFNFFPRLKRFVQQYPIIAISNPETVCPVPRTPQTYMTIISFPCLRELVLANCEIFRDDVLDLLGCAPRLRVLDLSGNPIRMLEENVFTNELRSLELKNCNKLKLISLVQCPAHLSVENCQALESMLFTTQSKQNYTGPYCMVLASRCPNLVRIEVLDHQLLLQSTADIDAIQARDMGYPDLGTIANRDVIHHPFSKGVYQPGIYYVFLENCRALESILFPTQNKQNYTGPYCMVFASRCPNLVRIEAANHQVLFQSTPDMDVIQANPDLGTIANRAVIHHPFPKGVYQPSIYYVFLEGIHVTYNWFTRIFKASCSGDDHHYKVAYDPNHRAVNFGIVSKRIGKVSILGVEFILRNLTHSWSWQGRSAKVRGHKWIVGSKTTRLSHWPIMKYREIKPGDVLHIICRTSDSLKWRPVKFGMKILYHQPVEEESDDDDDYKYKQVGEEDIIKFKEKFHEGDELYDDDEEEEEEEEVEEEEVGAEDEEEAEEEEIVSFGSHIDLSIYKY